MSSILDYWEEEEAKSNLLTLVLIELVFFFLMEASRQLYTKFSAETAEAVYLYLLAFILWNSWRGISPFIKRPNFDCFWVWTRPQLLGHFCLLFSGVFWYWNWPALDLSIFWATGSLLFSALFLPLSNLIRQPRATLIMAPLWLYFFAHCFGLIGLSYTVLDWPRGAVFVDLGFILSTAAIILFLSLYYFNKKDFAYLLYYVGPLLALGYYCFLGQKNVFVNYLELVPLEGVIN